MEGSLPDKIPPQSLEAEQAVLGAMLLEQDAIRRVGSRLSAADFYRDAHAAIFTAIMALFRADIAVDLVTLRQELADNNKIDLAGGLPYLTELLEAVPTSANVERYAEIVLFKSKARDAQRLGSMLINRAGSAEQAEIIPLLQEVKSAAEALSLDDRVEVLDWVELASMPPVDWLVRPYIQTQGLSIVTADPGSAKTWFGLMLACAVATGQPLMGEIGTKQGAVLYIDEETGPNVLGERMRNIGANLLLPTDMPLYFSSLQGLALTEETGRAQIETLIYQYQPTLVIMDPWNMMIPGADENSNAEIGVVLRWIRRHILKAGAACALIHHLRKRTGLGNDTPSERIRGAGAQNGAIDSHISLSVVGPSTFEVSHEKARGSKRAPSFRFDLVDVETGGALPQFREWLDEVNEADVQRADSRAVIINKLATGPLMRTSIVSYCGDLGLRASFVDSLLKDLYAEKIVGKRRVGRGVQFFLRDGYMEPQQEFRPNED